jgi:hypothetical protein
MSNQEKAASVAILTFVLWIMLGVAVTSYLALTTSSIGIVVTGAIVTLLTPLVVAGAISCIPSHSDDESHKRHLHS